ncbi:glucose-6-phosphate dehydrogenase [Pseudogracilibacillus sp. SE30717A]|uniref:glucose-6-phosphate dehydrogenase n=1 Tax=Pseudogracilibacillus sp. SE30717A TaxID=3098293 RepID=UPI00300E5D5D
MNNQNQPKVAIIIFGATGDLAKRKLFPSIYRLVKNKKIGENFVVFGTARRSWSNEEFRDKVKQSITDKNSSEIDLDAFVSHFYYHPSDVTNSSSYLEMEALLQDLEGIYQTEGNRIFYLAMSPEFFGDITNSLNDNGMKNGGGWTRLVIEKPFGNDLPSARKLNHEIRAAFKEEQIYRIDHYLGKEMVQNIEVIRFANGIFEHLWNNRFIANIQVTSSEEIGVEDRASYYDQSGAVRDMMQNHMLQMVALLAMEPPIKLTSEEIRSEKLKVLRALRKIENVDDNFVRGQYGEGPDYPIAYQQEAPALAKSNTETFVAGKIMIDNYRWAGVPFYIRTGKRMSKKSTQIIVEFKSIPMNLYYKDKKEQHPNLLVINISPNEGITLYLNAKKSGTENEAIPIKLTYDYNQINAANSPEAYEKLLYDCMIGDTTNFTHWDEVALTWEYVDPILKKWESTPAEFPNYKAGSMGPEASEELLKEDGFHWW